jgi:translation initiation factor IF-1
MKNKAVILLGTVVEALRGASFRVKLNKNDSIILAYLSGKMRINNIKVDVGDEVKVELSPYDLSRGRITRRL